MDKELKVGVDEFSLVFFYPIDDVCNDWQSTSLFNDTGIYL